MWNGLSMKKAAMEVAASAAYTGARTMVTMKQVGLNVASDPLMSLAYVGVEGGMVIVSADDPGPISSQTEQDTRRFAEFARIPVFDPSSPEEAYQMIQDAFAYSEKYKTPVLFRPTTRVCHAYASIEVPDTFEAAKHELFQKDSSRFVIFPRLSFANHAMIEKRNPEMGKDFSGYSGNSFEPGDGSSRKVIFTSGVSYAYVKEFMKDHKEFGICKIATAYPFPEDLARQALKEADQVLCVEELSPFIEEQLLKLVGKDHLFVEILGKLTGHVPASGENNANQVTDILCGFLWDRAEVSGNPDRRCTGSSCASAGIVRRMPAPCFFLCCKTGYEGTEKLFLRGHRMLHTGKCHAVRYGRHLSMHGSRCNHGPGIPLGRQRRKDLCFYRRFYLFCFRYDRSCQCGVQRSGYGTVRAG